MMLPLLLSLIEKAKGNPVGIVLAVCAAVLYKGGEALPEALEPGRAIIMGAGGLLLVIAGAWVSKTKPKDPPDPPAAP